MTQLQDDLKQVIERSLADGFSYDEDFIIKILDSAASWKQDWLKTFERLLPRIKGGQGTQDHANKGGKMVNLSLGDKFMAIFFAPENNGYFIYDFKIDKLK